MAGEDRYSSDAAPLRALTLVPMPGVTQVVVLQSDGTYVQRAISELDVLFHQYPESYAQLIGDEIEAAFRKARQSRGIRTEIKEGKL